MEREVMEQIGRRAEGCLAVKTRVQLDALQLHQSACDTAIVGLRGHSC